MEAIRAWELLCGGAAAAQGDDYTNAKLAARDMRRDYRGAQRVWRDGDPLKPPPVQTTMTASPRRKDRPSSGSGSGSPFLAALSMAASTRGRPSSAAAALIGRRSRSPGAGGGQQHHTAGGGRGGSPPLRDEHGEDLHGLHGAQPYDQWKANKAQRAAAERARLHHIQVGPREGAYPLSQGGEEGACP